MPDRGAETYSFMASCPYPCCHFGASMDVLLHVDKTPVLLVKNFL